MHISTASLPTPARVRVAAIDVVRGIALFGVLMVNLTTEFRVSLFQQFIETPAGGSALDVLLERAIALALASKAFSLFALLFGVGLAIQYERLARRGRPYYWLLRRLVALLAFGLIHLLLIWNGDILTEYALAGLLILPLLRASAGWTGATALALLLMFVAQPFMPWWIRWPDYSTLQHHVAQANVVLAGGGMADVLRFSWQELPLLGALHLFVLPRTLGLFALGMWVWKTGVFTRPRDFRAAILLVAIAGTVGGAGVIAADLRGAFIGLDGIRSLVDQAPVVLLALGYGAAIVALMEYAPAARLLAVFAPLGRMAFTNYLIQSVLFGLIFFGYGLGRFGRMATTPACALGLAVYGMQIVYSAWWLRRYRFGPVEWLWRTLMYGARQPMRRSGDPFPSRAGHHKC